MINRRQVHDISRLRNEFIDGVLHAQRLVELDRDACQRTVCSFISGPARQVESDESKAGRIPGYTGGRLGGAVLDFFDFEFARGPLGAGVSQSVSQSSEGNARRRTRNVRDRA